MRHYLLSLCLVSALNALAQLNPKTIEKKEGVYSYCYHKNGKVSTEEFRNSSSTYMAEGYSKAFDQNGTLIYSQTISRTGLLSSVHYAYYDNGAVKSAEYSAHPDAGIQWYKKTTYFDEAGKITHEYEWSNETQVTTPYLPDTMVMRLERQQQLQEEEKRQRDLKLAQEQKAKDSADFYRSTSEELEDGKTLEWISEPENGFRKQVIRKGKKILQITTEYYVKTQGVQKIVRTYYSNGLIAEETIYEAQVWHYRRYDKKGRLVEEKLNQSISHSK